LLGKGGHDPLADTAASFISCFPILLVLLVWADLHFEPIGLAFAIVSGGVTSGLGYALWYSILPKLHNTTAATVQLSVPVIAIVAGVLFLGEPLTMTILMSAVLVVGGIGWAVRTPPTR
jgi:drug/metabolite transporter (DMT)-like permease